MTASATPHFASRRARREFERSTAGNTLFDAPMHTPDGGAPATADEPATSNEVVTPNEVVTVVPPAQPASPVPATTFAVDATGPIAVPRQEVRRPPLTGRTSVVSQRKKSRRRSRHVLRRTWAKVVVIAAATGMVGTAGLPAYAYSAEDPSTISASGTTQTLQVGSAVQASTPRESFTVQEDGAILDSTQQSTVAGSVQYLAKILMTAVIQGRLTGSTPNHLFEIRNLAEGKAVPGCGVDYRVLQAIEFALQHFQTVGVSDINRRCTGQIEGAGTESAHYEDGGGHAVDFFRLDGQALDGGNAMSLKLIELLDSVVPPDTGLGQSECRSSISLTNMDAFPDTCDHVHIDFIDAKGSTLSS